MHVTRVVLLEPDRDSQELYAEYFNWVRLRKWDGLHVTVVPSASAALRTMSCQMQDALITCLRLPGTSGFALCDALRAVRRTSHLPVLALSTCKADYERAVCDGRFAAVLMKPCAPDVLLESLRTVVAAGHCHSESA